MRFSPRPYQQTAIDRMVSRPYQMLALRMGAGKTPVTLTAIAEMLWNSFEVSKVLVIAPLRVAELVWHTEAAKWDHTKPLRFSRVLGTQAQRLQALAAEADVYVINRENLVWLVDLVLDSGHEWPFDCAVIDETIGFKDRASKAWRALRRVRDSIARLYLLTGTPNPQGDLLSLWPQISLMDRGQRLGLGITRYKDRWYEPDKRNGHVIYSWKLKPGAREQIYEAVSDVMLYIESDIELPERIDNTVEVSFDMARYEELRREMASQEITAANAAVLAGKLAQVANGAVYDDQGVVHHIHDAKLDALAEIVEQGEPVLCFTTYRHDQARIKARFPKARVFDGEASMKDWAAGKIDLLLMHPACLGADTQVLTEWNGWTTITNVKPGNRVFDGVEFVDHSGCHYAGCKEVIELFGITMTPDHKLHIDGKWQEARDVRDSEKVRAEARELAAYAKGRGALSGMRRCLGDEQTNRGQKQSRRPDALPEMLAGHISPDDERAAVGHLARNASEMRRTKIAGLQKLRRTWDHGLRKVEGFVCKLLGGHGGDLSAAPYVGPRGLRRPVLAGELQVGYECGAAVKQAQQQNGRLSWRDDASRGTLPQDRAYKNGADYAVESGPFPGRGRCGGVEQPVSEADAVPGATLASCGDLQDERRREDRTEHATCAGNDRGSSCGRREKVSEVRQVQEVYDIVNCGPRHQFVIRNSKGEVFISHNSGGHGVDGLQLTGHTVVWFGLPFSLDHYDQATARLHRTGQRHNVTVHHIVARGTIDEQIMRVLAEKGNMQQALLEALKGGQ